MSYSAYATLEQVLDRVLRLERVLVVLILEEVSGSTNPIVRQTLLDFCDQVRDEEAGR